MKEGDFTRRLLAVLRKHPALKEAVVWKHNDASTGGIPDFSVSIGKHTEWFEVKIAPNEPTELQAYYLGRLRDGGHLITVFKDRICLDAIYHEGKTVQWLVEEIVIRCVNSSSP